MHRKNQPTDDLTQEFKIKKDGKTLQFYSDDGVKKTFEIHRYGEGKTLYYKRESNREKKLAYL